MTMDMITPEQESWSRVKGRLRAEVGDDIYSSWFARMDLEGLDDDPIRVHAKTKLTRLFGLVNSASCYLFRE